MGLLTSRLQAALLATVTVACATQLDESGVASDLESEGGGANMAGSSGSGTSGSTAKGGSTSVGKGGTGGTAGSSSGGKSGSSAGGSSAGTSSTAGSAGSSAGTGGSSAGSSGTGGGGSGGSGTSGTGGVVSTGDCDEPSDASKATAKCGSTIIYQNALYTCISQASGVNGEASGCGTTGVYCSQIDPDDAAWGTTAWTKLDDC